MKSLLALKVYAPQIKGIRAGQTKRLSQRPVAMFYRKTEKNVKMEQAQFNPSSYASCIGWQFRMKLHLKPENCYGYFLFT